MSGREEGQFLRGEIGVDGQAAADERDEAEVEQGKALEGLLRGRTYLGRELLTWLLWRTNIGGPICDVQGEPITVLLVDRVGLRGVGGDATEVSAKGSMAAYSPVVRAALARGLLLHSARLRIKHGERAFEVTLDAEHLDFSSVNLPKVLSEADDDRISERLYLTEQLAEIVEALIATFLDTRSKRKWGSKTVPAILEWIAEA